jgi:hypothetical protein
MRRLLAPSSRVSRKTVLALAVAIVGAGVLSAVGCSKTVTGPEQPTQKDHNTREPYGPPFIWDQD